MTKVVLQKEWYGTPVSVGSEGQKDGGLGGYFVVCYCSSVPRSEVISRSMDAKLCGLLS